MVDLVFETRNVSQKPLLDYELHLAASGLWEHVTRLVIGRGAPCDFDLNVLSKSFCRRAWLLCTCLSLKRFCTGPLSLCPQRYLDVPTQRLERLCNHNQKGNSHAAAKAETSIICIPKANLSPDTAL